jgi:hypothetical protein
MWPARRGACADDTAQTGKLQNDMQTNCPTVAPCPSTGCECPIDNNADTGVLINQFKVCSPVTCVGFAGLMSLAGLPVRVPQRRLPLGQREFVNVFTDAFADSLYHQLGALSNTHQTNCPTVAKCAM